MEIPNNCFDICSDMSIVENIPVEWTSEGTDSGSYCTVDLSAINEDDIQIIEDKSSEESGIE